MRSNGDIPLLHSKSTVVSCICNVPGNISGKRRAYIHNRSVRSCRFRFFFDGCQCFVGSWIRIAFAIIPAHTHKPHRPSAFCRISDISICSFVKYSLMLCLFRCYWQVCFLFRLLVYEDGAKLHCRNSSLTPDVW